MAGIAKGYSVAQILQGQADLWLIPAAYVPTNAALVLTLAPDGSPDSVTQPGCIHLGLIANAVTTALKPKVAPIVLDQYDAPVDGFVEAFASSIEGEMAQTTAELLNIFLGVSTYSQVASTSDQITWGGDYVVPTYCIACISPNRSNALQYVVSILYAAVSAGGFTISFGRKKPNFYKVKFVGMSVMANTPGQQQGVVYQTLNTVALTGTVTARNYYPSQIRQGPADLWLISPAPTDAAITVALDATTLTPLAATHGASVCFGLVEGAVELTVTPKLSYFEADQFDGPVGAFIAELECKLTATLLQAGMANMFNALGVGTHTLSAGVTDLLSFGGTLQPAEICIAAIAADRTAPTQALVACMYKTLAAGGVTWTASRKKPNAYKVEFTGLADLTRTPGRQIGNYFEMTPTPGEE